MIKTNITMIQRQVFKNKKEKRRQKQIKNQKLDNSYINTKDSNIISIILMADRIADLRVSFRLI
jgi:hypothetical protein